VFYYWPPERTPDYNWVNHLVGDRKRHRNWGEKENSRKLSALLEEPRRGERQASHGVPTGFKKGALRGSGDLERRGLGQLHGGRPGANHLGRGGEEI